MAKEKKKTPASNHGVQAAARRAKHYRAAEFQDGVWQRLKPLNEAPKSKHKTYYESFENTEKKKKLEYEITTDRQPPPGFEFIPSGNPELSGECKELSRTKDAMFFIVSVSKNFDDLEHHMNRAGHHFRQTIVDEARKLLKLEGQHQQTVEHHKAGRPEPIPKTQEEINREADAVLRDLFPRIPHTDRHEIIEHAFKKDGKFKGEYKVGMAQDLPLARRVQLAALAHIRHTKTRYDELLRETDWANARKAVEKPCLDIIVKWRGDEETGRDQLDEILREVIEISDSEDGSEDESSAEDTIVRNSRAISVVTTATARDRVIRHKEPVINNSSIEPRLSATLASPAQPVVVRRTDQRHARKTQQRFRRYAAAAEALSDRPTQNGPIGGSAATGLASGPMVVTRSRGSAQPTIHHREPTVVLGHSPRSRHTNSYVPVQAESPRFINGYSGERMAATVANGQIPSQVVRVVDNFSRPKVGPPVVRDHPHPSLSPVRVGLQDMLLPSVEPVSPGVLHGQHSSDPQYLSRESRQFGETTSTNYRTFREPVLLGSRPRSPGGFTNSSEALVKRRRVDPYSHRVNHVPPELSYDPTVSHSPREHPREARIEYLPGRPHPLSREELPGQPTDLPWGPSQRDVQQHRHFPDIPASSRNHSMIFDGYEDHQHRRVVEVRPPFVPERNQSFLVRRGPAPPARTVSNDYGERRGHQSVDPISHFQPRPQHLQAEPVIRRVIEMPSDSWIDRSRKIMCPEQTGRAPMGFSGNVYRESHTSNYEPERYEVRYLNDRDARNYNHPNDVEYLDTIQRPFPVHPAPASYPDLTSPPRIRERRDPVYLS
ncbi:hypothetical protein F5Y15DRAFT_182505 [Xylariaceae sp. FL0016]|nr:hypothetical protein F5Y15DRAFT_182505 [Xylariaceae sp. FL0016]